MAKDNIRISKSWAVGTSPVEKEALKTAELDNIGMLFYLFYYKYKKLLIFNSIFPISKHHISF